MDATVTEPVWVALIQWVIGPVSLALIGIVGARISKRLRSVEQSTNVVKNEVKNSHTTNLRNDLDQKFELVFLKLDEQGAKLDAHGAELRGMSRTLKDHSKDISELFRTHSSLRDDFESHRD